MFKKLVNVIEYSSWNLIVKVLCHKAESYNIVILVYTKGSMSCVILWQSCKVRVYANENSDRWLHRSNDWIGYNLTDDVKITELRT